MMRGLRPLTFFNTDVLNNYALMMSRCVTAAACSMSSSSLEKDFQLTNDTFYFSPETDGYCFFLQYNSGRTPVILEEILSLASAGMNTKNSINKILTMR